MPPIHPRAHSPFTYKRIETQAGPHYKKQVQIQSQTTPKSWAPHLWKHSLWQQLPPAWQIASQTATPGSPPGQGRGTWASTRGRNRTAIVFQGRTGGGCTPEWWMVYLAGRCTWGATPSPGKRACPRGPRNAWEESSRECCVGNWWSRGLKKGLARLSWRYFNAFSLARPKSMLLIIISPRETTEHIWLFLFTLNLSLFCFSGCQALHTGWIVYHIIDMMVGRMQRSVQKGGSCERMISVICYEFFTFSYFLEEEVRFCELVVS